MKKYTTYIIIVGSLVLGVVSVNYFYTKSQDGFSESASVFNAVMGTKNLSTQTANSGTTNLTNTLSPSIFNPLKNTPGLAFNVPPRKVSVILYKFQNDPNPPYTVEEVRQNFFEANPDTGLSMSDFMKLSSYDKFSMVGKTSIDGSTDVYGWYTLPVDRMTPCDQGGYQTRSQDVVDAARSMAVANGLMINPNDILVIGTFQNGCPGGGSVYGSSSPTGERIITMRGMDRQIWGNILHEFGHIATGSHHSNSIECSVSGATVIYGTENANCTYLEYGSPFSALGGYASGAPRTRLLDAMNKMNGGFLNSSNYLNAAQQSGVYDITKSNYAGAQILRVPFELEPQYLNGLRMGSSNIQYSISIEARDFLPFEQDSDTYPHTNVILIRLDEYLIRPSIQAKLLAPGETFNLNGTVITNMGPSIGNNRKVKVGVSYSSGKINDLRPSRVNYSFDTIPRTITINPQGIFSDSPVFSGNTYSEYGYSMFKWHVNPVRIYPGTGTFPLDGDIQGIAKYFTYTHPGVGTQTFSIPILDNLTINPIHLTGQPRSIYKLSINVTPFTVYAKQSIDIYLIYGQFTQSELEQLGVVSKILSVPQTPGTVQNLNRANSR